MPSKKENTNHKHNNHHTPQMREAYIEENESFTSSTNSSSSSGSFFFGVLFTVSELFLFGTIAIFVYWILIHDTGFSWQTNRTEQINLHAVLMLIGFIFLNGQAMLVYKLLSCFEKIHTKIIHTILFVGSISAIALGMLIGIQAQENVPKGQAIRHFYSIHSWIGLVTVALFALQFVVGFISFLVLLCCDKATSGYRRKLLPTHRTFGLIIFSLAAMASLTGLLQTARHRLSGKNGKPDYKKLEEPTIVINVVAACIIGLSIIIPYIVRNSNTTRNRHTFNG